MKDRLNVKTILSILALVIVAGGIAVFGYRVVVTSGELPGKLSSVSAAAANLSHVGSTMKKVQKVNYNTMKYGYMDGVLLAQMDYLDRHYENERMAEIRAVNDLTAMSEKTADRLAYEMEKAEKAEEAKKAREAAALAEKAKQARIQKLVDEMLAAYSTEEEVNPVYVDTGDGTDLGSGDTASRGGKKGKPVYATTHGKSLGKFVVTAYCTCKICCGIYSGRNRTASGTVPTTNRTIAVDTDVIPFGTKVVINGQVYVAEDRGSAIVGKRIDMFFYTHKEATRWGKRVFEVFLADDSQEIKFIEDTEDTNTVDDTKDSTTSKKKKTTEEKKKKKKTEATTETTTEIEISTETTEAVETTEAPEAPEQTDQPGTDAVETMNNTE